MAPLLNSSSIIHIAFTYQSRHYVGRSLAWSIARCGRGLKSLEVRGGQLRNFCVSKPLFLSSPSACGRADLLKTEIGHMKMEEIDLCNFGVTWCYLRYPWFFDAVFDNFFDAFFDAFFDKFF